MSKRRFLILGVTAAVLGLPFLFRPIFSSGFLPHSYCYLLNQGLIAVHVVSDLLIWLAYVVIASTLVYLVRKARNEIPFHSMFLAFGTFIVACGFTHFMEVVTLWRPLYWLAAYVKVITALASVITAIVLPFLVPRIVAMTKAAISSESVKADLAATNKELESFSYSVSHDLRAPLRQIDGFSRILLESAREKLSAEERDCLQQIRGGTLHMGRLVDDLLNFSRLGRQEPKRQTVDLDLLVADVVNDLRKQTGERDVQWHLAKLSPRECDPQLMKEVFTSLLSNAVKFTRPREHAVIEIGEEIQEGTPTLWVKDNGIGFDMKYANKLFGVFQRLHLQEEFEGTGVGLANVQRIILKHGGRVWAQAAPDRGATFLFTLGNGTAQRRSP